MGTLLYWRCRGCGAGELMCTGRKAGKVDLAPYADAARRGGLSSPLEVLSEDGARDGYVIEEEYVTYLCPECGSPILGTVLLIEKGEGEASRFYAAPEPCPSCGREPRPWDRRILLDAHSIHARLNRLLRSGCPRCGRTGVKHVLVNYGGKLTLNTGGGSDGSHPSSSDVSTRHHESATAKG